MRYRMFLTLPALFFPLLADAIDLDGFTDFAQEIQINSSISARVERVLVQPGQRVPAGALLLTLENTDFQANVAYAQARVDGLAPVVARRASELEKAEELYDRDSLATIELQRSEQDHAIALADLLAAQANLKRAQYQLSQTEIRAPIGGTVLSIDVHPGQFLNTRVKDPVLLTLVEDHRMIVRAMLPAEHWDRSLLNRAARIQIPNHSFDGRVIALGQETVSGNNNHPAIELRVRFEAKGQVPANFPVKLNITDN